MLGISVEIEIRLAGSEKRETFSNPAFNRWMRLIWCLLCVKHSINTMSTPCYSHRPIEYKI